MKRIGYDRNRSTRRISGRIDIASSTPTVGAGSGFTITDDGIGLVTVTVAQPGRSMLYACATPIQATTATGHIAKVISQSANSVQFGIYVLDSTDGALLDNVGFFFELLVKDAPV